MVQWIFGDLGVWVIAAVVGFFTGAVVARRPQPADIEPGHDEWLDRELASGPLGAILTSEQQASVRAAYGRAATTAVEPTAPTATLPPATPTPTRRDLPPQVAPVGRPVTPAPNLPPQVRPDTASLRDLIQREVPKDESPREPFSWDPAVILLYGGAFLVVTSGLVYASYNWADLGAWQKLGLLMALTIAFAGGGWLLLGIERVKEAARTFVAIGALLAPANAIAAVTVFDEDAVSPALVLLLGSLAIALLYGTFSIRPGGALYRYGAAIAATLAIGATIPAFGAAPSWGAVTVLLAAAILPDLVDRTGDHLSHLHRPFRLTMAAATVPATLVGIGAWTDNHWLPAITLAAATIAFGRIALRHHHDLPAIGGALSMAAIAPAALVALDPGSPAPFAWLLALASGTMIAAAQVLPPWSTRQSPRTMLHVEAVLGFALAGLAGSFDAPWLGALMLAIGAVATAVIAILRRYQRWWLLVASAFVAATWYALPGWDQFDHWDAIDTLRYAIPLPLLLAGFALGVERWAARNDRHRGWDLPVWTAAGIAAAATTLLAVSAPSILETDSGLRWAAATSAIYALGSLVAAWRLRADTARIGYALWGSLAVVLAALSLPVHAAWLALIVLVAAGLLAATALPGVLPGAGTEREQAATSTPGWLPAAIFGALGGLAVLAMLGFTATYIASAWRDDISGLPDSSWPWYLYMVTFAAIAATATWTGLRLGHEHDRTNESASLSFVTNGLAAMFTSLAFTTVAGLLLLRMITTDSLAWTRVGIAVAIALYAGVTYARDRETSNSFLPTMYNGVATLAIGIGAVSVAANLLLAIDEPDRVSATGQALTFGLAGVAVLVIAWWRVRPWLAVAGVALLAVATIFAARMGNNHDTAIPAGLVLLSWLVMATTIALQRAERGAHLGQVLRLAAIGVGFVAIVAAVGANGEADPGSTGWHVMAFTLVMAAALVATEGWLRQDRRWVIGASVLAMAALLLQIGGQEPSNIQAYTVPVALYLLALGWFSRRNRSLRDVLLALGSVALLAPPLLAAQADGDATQLLIGGVEALVLLVAGTFLRLRVAIAAGVAAITLIALRFLVDAALALEGWITLLAGGLLLLVIGTVLTIWKDALRERLERLQAGWHEMG